MSGLTFSDRREDPVLFRTLAWKGGEIQVCDFHEFPGSYNCDVVWQGPNERIFLVNTGDYVPELKVEGERLKLIYRSSVSPSESPWKILVFDAPGKLLSSEERITSGALPHQ